jgi:predicted MPP superfamily phosphohydrolase
MAPMTGLFLVSAAVDAAVLLALLLGRRRAALAGAGPALALKLVAFRLAGSSQFALLHLLYLDLVVALPLVGLGLVAARRHRASRRVVAVALALLALAPVGAYATFVEPERLRLETADVSLAPGRAGERPLRVAVLADIQTDDVGGHERDAIERARRTRPDVVLIPGDLFQMDRSRLRRELPELRELVRRLEAPGGVFAVPGDADREERLRPVLRGTGVRLLVNDIAVTRVAGTRLAIAGLELQWDSPRARATAAALERRPREDEVRILLAHRPDAVFSLPRRARTDLVVAGHTHGGQVQVPGIGPLITKSGVPRDVAGGGLHTLSGRRVYVSRGVGVERAGHAPIVRFLCPPEVSLLKLRAGS